MSPNLERISVKARANPDLVFTSLYHHIADIDHLRACYRMLQGNKAVGVDEVTKSMYAEDLEANLQDLSARLKRMGYRPQPKRRVYIPKPGSEKGRPLGISSFEDKIVELATKRVLEPLFESLFEECSYGYRPERSPHQCLDTLGRTLQQKRVNHLVEADIRGFFDAVHHEWLLKFLRQRIGDNRVLRLISRMLKAGIMEDGLVEAAEVGTPQGSILTPPTKLQTFFFGVRIARVRIDPKHDIDVIPGHFHPLDQRPDEVAFARPVGGLQAVVEFGRKVFQTSNNQLQFPVQGRFICQRLALLLQAGEALAQAGHPGLKLLLVDEALGITVDQPGDALAQLADLAFDRGQGRAFGVRLRLQAAPIFLREPLRVVQQRTDFPPDGQVQQIRAHLRILTEPLAAKAVRVRAQTAVIGVRARLAFAGTGAEAFAIEGIATVLALEQALQQIQGAPARLPGMALDSPATARWTAANTSGSTSAGTGIVIQSSGGTSLMDTARRGCTGRPRWARSRGRKGSWRVLPNAAAPV